MRTENLDEQVRNVRTGWDGEESITVPDSLVPTPNPLLELGLAHHEAGRLEQAQAMYRCLLDQQPKSADALHLLGVVEHQRGKHDTAIDFITRAISVNPNVALYHNNLGSAYQSLGRFNDAGKAIAASIALKPDVANAHYNLGVIFNTQGELAHAQTAFEHALVLQPDLTQAHYNLGVLLRRGGRYLDAAHSFRRVLSLQPENVTAQYLLAATNGVDVERAPAPYIEALFDADAAHFDDHLVNALHYDTPQRLLDLCVGLLRGARKKDMLDLGCGTGLMGASFAPYLRNLAGVDLSSNMLALAKERHIYQRLVREDMLTMMRKEASASFDIVTAADVFIYHGRLDDIFLEAKRLLRNGGMFIFSVEALDALLPIESMRPDAGNYQLNVNGRFAHSPEYVHVLAYESGFTINTMLCVPTRVEGGKAVMAWLVVLESSDDV
jgi:predicted TPR repeat methyltransferase